MVATLPALSTFFTAHTVSGTEWTQIRDAIKALSNIETANFFGTVSASSASASFVNITGATLAFNKQLASSDVLVFLSMSLRCTTTVNHLAVLGVNDGATDWQTTNAFQSTNLKHNSSIGWVKMTGLSTGAKTFQARLKADGTNTIAIDTNDCGFMIAVEVPN
jgi:hypothetical protein